jgi:hypothetical protein
VQTIGHRGAHILSAMTPSPSPPTSARRVVVSTSLEQRTYDALCHEAASRDCSLPDLLRHRLYGSSPLSSRRPGHESDLRVRDLLLLCAALLTQPRRGASSAASSCAQCDVPYRPLAICTPAHRQAGQRPGRRPLARTTVTTKMRARLDLRAQQSGMTLTGYLRHLYGHDAKIRAVDFLPALDHVAASEVLGRLTWCAGALSDPSLCQTCWQRMSDHLQRVLLLTPSWPERRELEAVIHALV